MKIKKDKLLWISKTAIMKNSTESLQTLTILAGLHWHGLTLKTK